MSAKNKFRFRVTAGKITTEGKTHRIGDVFLHPAQLHLKFVNKLELLGRENDSAEELAETVATGKATVDPDDKVETPTETTDADEKPNPDPNAGDADGGTGDDQAELEVRHRGGPRWGVYNKATDEKVHDDPKWYGSEDEAKTAFNIG